MTSPLGPGPSALGGTARLITPVRIVRYACLVELALIAIGSTAWAQTSADAAAVRQARLEQNAALAARNIDRAAKIWTDDIVVRASLGRLITGAASYRRALEVDSSVVFERVPDRIQVSNPWSIAWEEGRWTGKRTGPAGQPLIRGRYAAQWIKIDGTWRIRSELFVATGCAGAGCERTVSPP